MCPSHGGAAPQVRRKAAERVDLHRLIVAARARSPRDVMAEAVAVADALLAAAVESGCVPDMADALDRAARVARHSIATTALDPLTGDNVDREIARLERELGQS